MNEQRYNPATIYGFKSLAVIASVGIIFTLFGCTKSKVRLVNIGLVAPLSVRATDLGVGPAKAMELAVVQYNSNRASDQPEVKLYVEDDQWEKEKALAAYDKLQNDHNVKVVFVCNTGGTIAIQDRLMQDNVICVNPINNDELLSTMNENTFSVAKRTEVANGLIGARIIELGLKKAVILHFPNDFMTRGANAVKAMLDDAGIENTIVQVEKDQIDFTDQLIAFEKAGYDAYGFFGYREFGFAMKQARELGIKAPFFGSTTLKEAAFYDNSEGAIIGSECSFFMPQDGHEIRANVFIDAYVGLHGSPPPTIWPAMQAYDAVSMVLEQLSRFNLDNPTELPLSTWLKNELHKVRYYEGICGNISIGPDGTSKGIYFSLYRYESKDNLVRIKH